MQSFLSLALFPFNSYLLLAAVKEKLLGRMETCCGVLLSQGMEEGQLLSDDTYLGVHRKTCLFWRDKDVPVHLDARQSGLPSALTQSTGTGAVGRLPYRFLLRKSKIFPKGGRHFSTDRGYCCFVKFFNEGYGDCIQHL